MGHLLALVTQIEDFNDLTRQSNRSHGTTEPMVNMVLTKWVNYDESNRIKISAAARPMADGIQLLITYRPNPNGVGYIKCTYGFRIKDSEFFPCASDPDYKLMWNGTFGCIVLEEPHEADSYPTDKHIMTGPVSDEHYKNEVYDFLYRINISRLNIVI